MPALIRGARLLVAGVLIGGGFYFLLIDTTSLPELYVLAGVALACAVARLLAREQGFVEAAPGLVWLPKLWRLILKIPSDIAVVCGEALAQAVRPRAVRGEFRAGAYRATAHTPAAAGRQALTETLGSLAPNTIVVGVDTESGLLLVHQLRRQGGPETLDVMRLG